jgi:hypothetical protein
MNYPVKISAAIYVLLESLLKTGKIDYEGKIIDFSEVQTMTLKDNKLVFDPPAKISAQIGFVRVRTTITEIEARDSGVQIGIDNSPIDVEIQPE